MLTSFKSLVDRVGIHGMVKIKHCFTDKVFRMVSQKFHHSENKYNDSNPFNLQFLIFRLTCRRRR